MKMLLILLFSLNLLCGCIKNPDFPVLPADSCLSGKCDTSKLEILWEEPIATDTSEWNSVRPIYFNGEVMFSRYTFSAGIDTFKFYDAANGTLKRKWFDYIPGRKSAMTDYQGYFTNGKFFFTTWKDVYSINFVNSETAWLTKLTEGEGIPTINILGNKVYHAHLDKRGGKTYNSYLVAADVSNGKWDTVHRQSMINNFEPMHCRPGLWISPQGDSILVFQIRYINFSAPASKGLRTDVVAYNTTKKEEYFRLDSLDDQGSVHYPYIVGSKALVSLSDEVVCIDMLSKRILWKQSFRYGFSGAQPLIYVENKLFVKSDNRSLYQLDIETGNIVWQDLDNGSGASEMVYHNGIIYYTCSGNGKIYAVDVSSGKKIWAEVSPNKYKNSLNGNRIYNNANIGFGGIAIDSSSGNLYTSDFYFHICLKLPNK